MNKSCFENTREWSYVCVYKANGHQCVDVTDVSLMRVAMLYRGSCIQSSPARVSVDWPLSSSATPQIRICATFGISPLDIRARGKGYTRGVNVSIYIIFLLVFNYLHKKFKDYKYTVHIIHCCVSCTREKGSPFTSIDWNYILCILYLSYIPMSRLSILCVPLKNNGDITHTHTTLNGIVTISRFGVARHNCGQYIHIIVL